LGKAETVEGRAVHDEIPKTRMELAASATGEGKMSGTRVSNRQEAEDFLYGLSPRRVLGLLLNALDDETLVRIVNRMIEQLDEGQKEQ
jgi:hypothetical protein